MIGSVTTAALGEASKAAMQDHTGVDPEDPSQKQHRCSHATPGISQSANKKERLPLKPPSVKQGWPHVEKHRPAPTPAERPRLHR